MKSFKCYAEYKREIEAISKIQRIQEWSYGSVRRACIKNDLYTRGDNESYSEMLDFVDENPVTDMNLYLVAKDITEHSKYQTIANVMYILINDAVTTYFEIDGNPEF